MTQAYPHRSYVGVVLTQTCRNARLSSLKRCGDSFESGPNVFRCCSGALLPWLLGDESDSPGNSNAEPQGEWVSTNTYSRKASSLAQKVNGIVQCISNSSVGTLAARVSTVVFGVAKWLSPQTRACQANAFSTIVPQDGSMVQVSTCSNYLIAQTSMSMAVGRAFDT